MVAQAGWDRSSAVPLPATTGRSPGVANSSRVLGLIFAAAPAIFEGGGLPPRESLTPLTVSAAFFVEPLAIESDLSKTVRTAPFSEGTFKKSHLKPFNESTIMETRIVRVRAHQKNIDRYEGLLQTKLSEAERQYIEKRLSEERLAMAMLQFMSPGVPSKAKDPLRPQTEEPY